VVLLGAVILKADIDDTRKMVADLKLPTNITIGNSDAGSFFSKEVLQDVDYGVRRFIFLQTREIYIWV
jgi:hypothetical protein